MSWQTLIEFEAPSELGTERQICKRVVDALGGRLEGEKLERLETAVTEGAMNAIEHGNHGRPELPVLVLVQASEKVIKVSITDQGGEQPIPETTTPNIEAKLAGLEKVRGWGLFLIRNMTDEMQIHNAPDYHRLDLIFYLESADDEHEKA